jgi:hypothetical protein
LRENSEIDFANRNFVLTSINLKNKSAGDGCRDKTIEKTILRTFRARTFSRSLDPKRTWPRNAQRRRDWGPTHCQQFPFPRILIGPEAVSGLTSSLKKMRFFELFVREVTTFIANIGMSLQKRKTS